MKAIDTETGEVVADDLAAGEIERLVAAGADLETEEAEGGAGGESGNADARERPDAVADTDDYDPERERMEKAGYAGDDEVIDEESVEEVEMDTDRSALDWHGVDPDEEVETVDIDTERRFERLQTEEDLEETDLEQDKRDRAEALDAGMVEKESGKVYDLDVPHEDVRQHLRESGQAEQIVEAFSQFKTADRWVTAEDGEMLNEDAVVDLIGGDTGAQDRLYQRKLKAEPGDRAVVASMDMSGSMNGVTKQAKSALAALALACREIGDDFTANAWTSTAKRGKKNQRISLITGPDEEFEWEHLDSVWPCYQDPITPGMRHAKQMNDEVSASERLMVVITDGQPLMCADGQFNGAKAITEAQEEVRKYRADGYTVIGMGIQPGVDHDLMSEMFGEGGYVLAGQDDLADALVGIYKDQMNVGGGR